VVESSLKWEDYHEEQPVFDPGCPWQNGYGESFNGTVRDECLNMYVLCSVAEACVRLESFRQH